MPISPSTVTPRACAYSTTSFVTATLYSNEAGVLPSPSSEPSIITLVKPRSIAEMHVSGSLPWSRWSETGISGYSSTAACIRCQRKRSFVYDRAPREAWMITGEAVSRAASMIAWICSMLLTLNAPTP